MEIKKASPKDGLITGTLTESNRRISGYKLPCIFYSNFVYSELDGSANGVNTLVHSAISDLLTNFLPANIGITQIYEKILTITVRIQPILAHSAAREET